jgi:SAM-dependent methyltransferase
MRIQDIRKEKEHGRRIAHRAERVWGWVSQVKESSFDVVCGNSFLHHVDLEAVFNQIRYVLKKDGRIVFTEPNMFSPGVMIQKNIKLVKMLSGDTPDETAFFRWSLKYFLQKRGFVDIRIEPFDFLSSFTPLPFISWIKRGGTILERLPLFKEIAGSLVISGRML